MAIIELPVKNHMGAVATLKVDEDQMMPVPSTTDESGQKRAGDLVPGDAFCHGRRCVFTVAEPA